MRVCWEDHLEDSAVRNTLARFPVSLLTWLALPYPLGLAPEVRLPPTPQHTSLLTFQCVMAAGAREPGACLQVSAHRPFPRCHGQEWPARQLFVARELLELQSGEDMEIETGEAGSKSQRAPGPAGETQPRQSDHIIYWCSWGDIYG